MVHDVRATEAGARLGAQFAQSPRRREGFLSNHTDRHRQGVQRKVR